MKKMTTIMSMPVTIEVVDGSVHAADIESVFAYFRQVDEQFSMFKKTSEISKINRGELRVRDASAEMKHVLALCIQTKKETHGYFDPQCRGGIDPTGIVKGYAIHHGAKMLHAFGYHNFSVEIAGDIEVSGHNAHGKKWRIGIQNPFQLNEVIKVVELDRGGIATSGNYQRGRHIFNPLTGQPVDTIASMTIIGPNVYEADRFATPAFAMGTAGIYFVESLPNCEGYMVTNDRRATLTTGFERYVALD